MGPKRLLRRFRRDERGVAAIEAAFVTSAFAIAMLNAVEVGRYAYILMEADQATQVGAQAALVACDAQHVPATQSCPNLSTAVTTAIQGTTLGSNMSLNGAITEGYYCLNAAGALVFASNVSSKPANCSSAVGNANLSPVLYLQVHTRYAYAPMFPGLTVAQAFPKSVQKTAWMRML
jgi:Flp pilus assembly protein TadG